MKRINYFLLILAFIAGSIGTISLIGVITYANRSVPPGTAPQPGVIPNAAIANGFYHKYADHATAIVMKGINIDKEALEAMNTLKGNPLVNSFRIYFGVDNGGAKIGIIVGVNSANKDIIITNGIYETNSLNFGPCPDLCDNTSPIIQ